MTGLSNEYIFQEMLEQERIAVLHQSLSLPHWPANAGKVIITGSGDSYCAALFGSWILEKRGQVSALPALEASQTAQHLVPEDILVVISVSGRTIRVLEAAKRALAAGAQVVAVTDNLESPLAELAAVVWPIHASPAVSLNQTSYQDQKARQYVGYHHDVAQTKTFWAVLLTLVRAAQAKLDWQGLLVHTSWLLSTAFYRPLITKANAWAQSDHTFFLGSGCAKIIARFASYKMHEFNRLAHFTGIEEYCHTHYFITRPGDTIVFLILDQDTAARAGEIVPVLCELFDARIIWLQPESVDKAFLPVNFSDHIEVVDLPDSSDPLQQFLDLVLAVQWITYLTGRIGAPNINTFHAGYDTERLVAGTLRTIRQSAIRLPEAVKKTAGEIEEFED
jgi:DNA-binding MurR/RpiR family transcriptional regulator